MNSKKEMRRGIRTKEGEKMAEKKFQLDEVEADLDNDGKLSEYERARGEAIQKAMLEDEPVKLGHGGLMSEDGCGCDECMGESMGYDMYVGMDPISGNMIPPGSNEENVRDDIPAALSDGEYVVPADVVRYHGLKTFMYLREEAKIGLMAMAMEGQIQTIEEEDMEEEEYHVMPDGTIMPGATHGEYEEEYDEYEEDMESEEEMPNYKDKQAEMTDLNYDGQEDYETPEDNVVEIAQTEVEETVLSPEEEEEDEYSMDGKNTYRPRVQIAMMKV